MNKRLIYITLTVLGGLLPAIAWPPNTLPFLLFIAFVPLLLLEQHFTEKGRGTFFGLYTYLGLFIFNLITTWWVWNASPGGAVFMLFANTFLMLLPFLVYRFTKRIVGQGRGLFMFVISWLSFEYFHFRWDLAYPWLTLGNAFATTPSIIQWYEYTGALGGSFWILSVNVLIFHLTQTVRRSAQILTASLIVFPVCWSLYLGTKQQAQCYNNEVVLIQPNIDPYLKFDPSRKYADIDSFITLCESAITPKTKLIILPETALVGNMNEDQLVQSYGIRQFKNLQKRNPGVGILVGASTHRFYKEGEKLPIYPRYLEQVDKYYDSYNTAVQIDGNGDIETYHKSKLVPGVESLPFPQFFKQFDDLMQLDLGGVAGNLGIDQQAKSFHYSVGQKSSHGSSSISVAPLICYESIFGEYVGQFVKQRADIIAVITNDGWWKNTAGHKQHMHYARLRAIEYRRYVVRSANTGITCAIDDNGEVLKQLGWWERGTLTVKIPSLKYTTFYAKAGDYIGKLALFIFFFMGLSVLVKWKIK